MKITPLIGLLGLALAHVSFAQNTNTTWPFSANTLPGIYDDDFPPATDQPRRSVSQQRVIDANEAGDYVTAGGVGLVVIANENPDDALRLTIANSLAWTGKLKEAAPAYLSLTRGSLANEANVGLGNLNRWRGRDDQAVSFFRSVLANDPANAGALEGLELATRELSPRTTIGFGRMSDSSDMLRRSTSTNHRWRDASGVHLFEVEMGGIRDALPTNNASQQDMTGRYQGLDLPLKPSIEISMPTGVDQTLHGTAKVTLLDESVTLGVGRVNWAKLATNPNALIAGLSAKYLGATVAQPTSTGHITGRVNYYDISDGNTILTSSANFDSAWRPFGRRYKPYMGFETRTAHFSTPNYWSPDQGSGTAYAGLLGEWSEANWSLFASAQLSTRLYGDASNGWSVSAGGKRWLTNDIALGTNLWAMENSRDSSRYKSQSLMVNLEKLWR